MEYRVRKLEDQMLEISSKVDTRSKATHDLLKKLVALPTTGYTYYVEAITSIFKKPTLYTI